MDTQKIGSFLRELRTEKGLTQEQLGEQLGVTNKTVSRWETGTYMPPVECLKLMSDFYGVSINELLSGERLAQESYRTAAEENIASALKGNEEKQKRFENIMLIILAVTTVITCAIIFLLPDGEGLTSAEKIQNIVIIILVVALSSICNVLNMVALLLNKRNGDK